MTLILFDCDGTLVDSQHLIVEAMNRGFKALELTPPSREATLSIVGLSLPLAITKLIEADDKTINAISDAYKNAYHQLRAESAIEPFYPGMKELILKLEGHVLGVATGKNMRGLKHVLQVHGLYDKFTTLQTADDAPSKPHPGMIHNAMRETGCEKVIMIGDTTFDIHMAMNAKVKAIGVSWGYHPVESLIKAGAHDIAYTADELFTHIEKHLE
jgi:phosphoglycolate phosphatase